MMFYKKLVVRQEYAGFLQKKKKRNPIRGLAIVLKQLTVDNQIYE